MVVKTLLDSRELAFLIPQIDEYIQVMEVLIRKTPALDTGELALARNLRKKLLVGKQAERGRKSVPKESGFVAGSAPSGCARCPADDSHAMPRDGAAPPAARCRWRPPDIPCCCCRWPYSQRIRSV